ncbi:MAG: hypothetical protein MPK03_00345 [Alphaproteobacteria bacterium]|nr:hypothetical protein [Alphaproteobacteria bacterium]
MLGFWGFMERLRGLALFGLSGVLNLAIFSLQVKARGAERGLLLSEGDSDTAANFGVLAVCL